MKSRGSTQRGLRVNLRRVEGQPKKLVECCFTSTKTVGILGTGAQDGHLDLHTVPELRPKKDRGST